MSGGAEQGSSDLPRAETVDIRNRVRGVCRGRWRPPRADPYGGQIGIDWDRLNAQSGLVPWPAVVIRFLRCHAKRPCRAKLDGNRGESGQDRTARKSANRPSFYRLPMESTIWPVGETRGHGFSRAANGPQMTGL